MSDPYEPIMRSDCEKEKQELIEKFLNDKKEELKIIQDIWYKKNDFDKEEKFDIIIGYLDNQKKKWKKRLKQ